MKVVRLSALRTGRLYNTKNIPGRPTHFCWRLSRPQGDSVAGRIKSMKNPNDFIGNQTRDLPACSAWVCYYRPQFLVRSESLLIIFFCINRLSQSQWPRHLKAWVCGRSLTGTAGSNPAGDMDVFPYGCCVLSGSALCVGLITRPDGSCGLWCV
jgi:hypothetical protein